MYSQEAAPAPASQTTTLSQTQLHEELQQRVLGLVPNFFVIYTPHPVPLTPKQKFQLGLRSSFDSMALLGAGVSAAYGQYINDPKSFGQGARGYGERVGVQYGADLFGTMVGKAVLPSLLKQDPRYFYKGAGSRRSRLFYAVANSFICMGDNGRWQLNASETMGSLATASMLEFQYPPRERYDVERVFRNFIAAKAGDGLGNIFQEFFSRRLTVHSSRPRPALP